MTDAERDLDRALTRANAEIACRERAQVYASQCESAMARMALERDAEKKRAEAAEARVQALQQELAESRMRCARQALTVQQRQEAWAAMRDGIQAVVQKMRNAVAGLGASDRQVLEWADSLATLTPPGAAERKK